MTDIMPRNLCESCRKKTIENCEHGPKEHCGDYKSELQWQFEHYESDDDKREAAKRKAAKVVEQKKKEAEQHG
jgi:hypothetical protein